MAYVKILYQDSPSTATPLNAQNLNHMDDQIALNDQRLTEIETSYVKSFNGRKGDVTPQVGDYDMSKITPTSGAAVGQIPIVRNDGTEEEPNLTFHMEDVPSSGHVIQNASGTDMAQEDAMQFADAFVSNDSVNGRTVVENIKEVDPADYASTTDEGIIVTDNEDDALIGAVSDDKVDVVADGVKTYEQLLAELFNDVDTAKITGYTYISVIANYTNIFRFGNLYSGTYRFMLDVLQPNSDVDTTSITIGNTCSYINYDGTTYHDYSSNKPSNGTKITLYYGNKKATVDLQTTANRCLMSDGNNLEQVYSEKVTSGSGTNISIEIYKYGKVVYVVFGNGRYTASANATLATIPKGFRPMIVYADFRDTYSDKRIRIKPDGTVYCDEALSDVIIRGSLCYIAN